MKRARRLLEAYNELNNAPTSVISHMSLVVIYIIVLSCLYSRLIAVVLRKMDEVNTSQNLAYFNMVVVLLVIRSIYTGFFEDKREGTKNSLKALTIHLPISKKDFIWAQYIGSLYVFLPAFILLISLIVLNHVGNREGAYQLGLGIITGVFGLTYCIMSLEKGLFNYYYIDPRFREAGYLIITFIWMAMNYFIGLETSNKLEWMISQYPKSLWIKGMCGLSGGLGIIFIIIMLIIGYFFQMKLPIILERRR